MLGEFPAIRQVFHALCALEQGEDATELLDFAVRQEWMAGLARRAASVARLDHTTPWEPEADDLHTTLWQLYAAARVRDALLLAHQPGPAGDSVRELDEALHREQPRCRTVPVGQATQFFAAIGCRPVTEASFDPILHEIITCEPAAGPGDPILITGQAWPALMIGELVFARAGVHVRAGAAHVVPGIADRSALHWEHWAATGSPATGPSGGVITRSGKRKSAVITSPAAATSTISTHSPASAAWVACT